MIRRIGLVAAVAGLQLSIIAAGVAHAAPPVPGVGTGASCRFDGKAKIKPKLINGGTATPVTTKVKGKITACTGGTGDAANISQGKVKGVIVSMNTNDCNALATSGLPAFDLAVKWKVNKGSPKITPSTVKVGATPPGNIAITPATITITLNGTMDPAGSFANNAVTSVAHTDEDLNAFGAACGGKGLKGFNFTGLAAVSTFAF
jgi:hypothetical protein